MTYTPNAASTQQDIQESLRDSLVEVEDKELRAIIDKLDQDIEDNPELLKLLIEYQSDS